MNKVTTKQAGLIECHEMHLPLFELMLKETSEQIVFRAINNEGKAVGVLWSRNASEILKFIKEHNGKNNLYFGTATRTSNGGKKIHCREVLWLWADIDNKDFEGGEEEARKRLDAFKYPPSIIIRTGGGFHCYWILKTVLDAQENLESVERALRVLIAELNADQNRKDISSLLRVPDSVNVKPGRNEAVCKIENIDLDQKITLQDILALEKLVPINQPQSTPKSLSEFRKAVVIGNRDSGTMGYVNAYIKQNGTATNDSELEKEVYAFLDQAGGDGLDAIKKKVPGWIQTAHELFDTNKKLSTIELVESVIQHFDGSIIYLDGRFLAYSGGLWKRVNDDQIKKLITEKDGFHTSRSRIVNSFEVLKFRIATESIEPDAGLICVINGTLELSSGKLLPHSPDYHFLNRLSIGWNPKAKCTLWKQTLSQIFKGDPDREDKIRFLQEWFGYCHVPETWLHKFLLMVGSGGNGKSLILEILSALMGNANISNAMLTRLGQECVRAELSHKLINISSEMKAESTLSSGYLKAIVAGEMIEARFKYGQSFSFRPYVRLVSATNELPRLLDYSDGFRRRAIILQFNRSFKDHEQDKHRKGKLINELPGILLWALQGLRRLRKNDAFTIPISSDHALSEYMKESDPVSLFAGDELVADESGHLTSTPLYTNYSQWANERGFQKLNIINFGKRLKALGFTKRSTNGKEVWCVRLKTANLHPKS